MTVIDCNCIKSISDYSKSIRLLLNTFAAKAPQEPIPQCQACQVQGLVNIEGIWVQHRVSPEPFNLSL